MYPPVTQFETRWAQLEQWIAERDLNRESAQRRREVSAEATPNAESVLLRLSHPESDDALPRLARLDGRPAPVGPHIVAEVAGAIVAALPLGPGAVLADPFRPTAHLMPLLELRAKQFADDTRPPRTRSVLRALWSRA